MDSREFRLALRVTRVSFALLLAILEPHITKKTTNFGKPLSAPLATQFGIGKSTGSGIMCAVAAAIVSHIKKEQLPTTQEGLL
ncbi:hypothetical protein L914_21556 [Phytophthora nicotianae]|uniref:Uncharacterized protein n=2 Tax=Phytophthora nicotianae TaxID=4792 RepID=V9DUN1_PHYNI|nr:hypothetical protein F443_23162 [Phytophthora nicotianae P1569]ETM30763.1 hypothetical protein L914_21556 [Phytophthora nicotianae]